MGPAAAPLSLSLGLALALLVALVGLAAQQPAAAFVVPAPAFPHPWQQHRSLATPATGRHQQHARARRPLGLAAAATTSSTAVPRQAQAGAEEGSRAGGRAPRSMDELLTEIRLNAGTPQVLSLLKEAVEATGTGEVRKEVFKVRPSVRAAGFGRLKLKLREIGWGV